MERRLLIAVLLSIAFLFGWSVIAPRIFPALAPPPPTEEATSTAPATSEAPARPLGEPETSSDSPVATTDVPAQQPDTSAHLPVETAEEVRAGAEELVSIQGETYRARLSNHGARFVSFQLLDETDPSTGEPGELVFQQQKDLGPFSIFSDDETFRQKANEGLYVVERSGPRTVTFTYSAGDGTSVVKRLEFDPVEPLFDYEVTATGSAKTWGIVVGPGIGATGSANDDRFKMSGTVVVEDDGDAESVQRRKMDEPRHWQSVRYAGLVDHYFLTVLLPDTPAEARAWQVAAADEDSEAESAVAVMADGSTASGRGFFAPKRRDLLKEHGLGALLSKGFLGPISNVLLQALTVIHGWVGNYGWAIVLLTVFIKILFFPLQHKSMVSMKRMQKVQPKMNAIRDRYKKSKSDPAQRQKMNVEMMQLYKDEKISPASGCVPMLLQLPILWAFYIALSHAIELRGEPWILWITDLSSKDPYYILPIVMTGTMFVQQLVTPMAGDPMQRKLMLGMPLVFGFIFKEFPAGLVLYWLVQNVLTIVQQGLLNRWWKNHPESLEAHGTLATVPAREGRGKR